MSHRLLPLLLAACQSATWQASFEPDEAARLGQATDDGCTLRWTRAALSIREAYLEQADGTPTAAHPTPWAGDVLSSTDGAGVSTETRAGRFAAVVILPGPPDDLTQSTLPDDVLTAMSERDAALWLEGTLSCDDLTTEAVLRWALPGPAAQRCGTPRLEVGGEAVLQLPWTLSLTPLFDAAGTTRARPLLRADLNDDGEITLEELSALDPAPLGYLPDEHTGPATLADLLRTRSRHTLTLPDGTCAAR